MSDTGVPIPTTLPPSPPRKCCTAGGYEACFYPGFVRRLAIQHEDGSETLLYDQDFEHTKMPFVLPAGQLEPWPSSTLELRGNGRDIMLMVNDPGRQIDQIEVVLKPLPGGRPERLVLQDHPILCPPICPE